MIANGRHIIATGSSECGGNAHVRVWRIQSGGSEEGLQEAGSSRLHTVNMKEGSEMDEMADEDSPTEASATADVEHSPTVGDDEAMVESPARAVRRSRLCLGMIILLVLLHYYCAGGKQLSQSSAVSRPVSFIRLCFAHHAHSHK